MGKVLNKFNEVIEKVQDAWLWLSNKQYYLERHPVKKEERMELLHLLRNMGRRYNVSKSSGKHSMYTKEYAKYDKLKEKLSTKIDETLSNLKNSEWIRLIPPDTRRKAR